MFRKILEYVPAVLFSIFATFIIIRIATIQIRKDSPNFEPVEARPLKWITPGPFTPGQMVTIQDGICNNSKEILQTTTVVGFQEVGVDRLSARNIVIIPNDNSQPQSRPLLPGCLGTDPVTGPLPAIPAGKWQLYITIVVMGPQSGQIQRISLVTDTVEVRNAGSS